MRECLWEIAELPLCAWVVFFREQANIIAQRKQALEQGACFSVPMLQPVVVGKPEAAREKLLRAASRRRWPRFDTVAQGRRPRAPARLLLPCRAPADRLPAGSQRAGLAAVSHLPKLWVKVSRSLSKPCSQIVACMRSRERSPLVHGVNELAVDIELKLRGSCVADAHRRNTPVARQPRYLPLDKLPFAGQAIHDLELVRASRHGAPVPLSHCPHARASSR